MSAQRRFAMKKQHITVFKDHQFVKVYFKTPSFCSFCSTLLLLASLFLLLTFIFFKLFVIIYIIYIVLNL